MINFLYTVLIILNEVFFLCHTACASLNDASFNEDIFKPYKKYREGRVVSNILVKEFKESDKCPSAHPEKKEDIHKHRKKGNE